LPEKNNQTIAKEEEEKVNLKYNLKKWGGYKEYGERVAISVVMGTLTTDFTIVRA